MLRGRETRKRVRGWRGASEGEDACWQLRKIRGEGTSAAGCEEEERLARVKVTVTVRRRTKRNYTESS